MASVPRGWMVVMGVRSGVLVLWLRWRLGGFRAQVWRWWMIVEVLVGAGLHCGGCSSNTHAWKLPTRRRGQWGLLSSSRAQAVGFNGERTSLLAGFGQESSHR